MSLGANCTTNADCAAGDKCVRSLDDDPLFHGGPAGGYCTRACASDAECAGGVCLGAPAGECLLDCTPGPTLAAIDEPLDPAKCLGRGDLACGETDGGAHACLPTCGRSSQCAVGLCSPRTGVCVSAIGTGKDFGSACTPNNDLCVGYCEPLDAATGACTTACVLGGDVHVDDCGGLAEGLCLPSQAGQGAGDRGVCAAACTQHDHCVNPGLWCVPVAGLAGGFCAAAASCAAGEACTPGTCTQTIHGAFCLDPAFPLGSAAP